MKPEMENIIKVIASALATLAVYVFGGWDIALQSLLIVIIIDFLTGVAKAYTTKQLSSNIGFKGVVKKVCVLAMVAVATVTDRVAGETGLIRQLVIYYLVANEGLSIIENLGAMDLFVPQILKDKLAQLSEKNNKKGDSENA